MKPNVFERETDFLARARLKLSESPSPEDYRELLAEYEKLLRQGVKIVSIGDSTQNKLIRAQKMLHRAIQRYKATAEQKSEILALISHEIKNKASPIRELTRLAIDDLETNGDTDHARELLRHVSDASDQLIKSVNDTLHRESSRSSSIVPVFEWSDLSKIAASAVENQIPCAQKKNIAVSADIEPGCESLVDEFLLGEVFENLVGNAIKFSPAGSKVHVVLRLNGEAFVFSVRDEGPGLSADDKLKIFGKYQTLSAKPTGGETSTGIGLYISNKLAALHNGSIEVLSDGPGRGSTFIVRLPLPQGKNSGIPGMGATAASEE